MDAKKISRKQLIEKLRRNKNENDHLKKFIKIDEVTLPWQIMYFFFSWYMLEMLLDGYAPSQRLLEGLIGAAHFFIAVLP